MTKASKRVLPVGILVSDLSYPKSNYGKDTEAQLNAKRVIETLEFYKTERFGWVINTLFIRNASRRQQGRGVDTQRFYAISVDDGTICTVGLGPHVTDKFTLYVTNARKDALQKFLDLHQKGLGEAGTIRDRISTKRAQTSLRRNDNPWRW